MCLSLAFFVLAAFPLARAEVRLPAPAASLYERVDPGLSLSAPRVRIGLSGADDEVRVGSTGAFRILDGRTGAELFKQRTQGEIRVLQMGGAPRERLSIHRIQVASFADESRARALARTLEDAHRAESTVAWDASRNVWRVRLGGAESADALATLLRAVREAGHPEAWIASEPRVRDEGGTLALVDRAYLRVDAGADRVIVVPVGTARVTVAGKSYRGVVEVLRNEWGGVQAVNEVPLEDYLRGVVPEELGPAAWPELEAIKAQAVAARTYILANLGQYAAQGYDICDTPRCQVYGGAGSEHPLSDRAVAETRGEILVYEGAPINALYTSTCGGHTEDLRHVFPEMTGPYLKGVACVASEERLASRRIDLAGRPVAESEPVLARGDEALWRARLIAAGIAPRALLDPAWRGQPVASGEAGAWFRAFARAAGYADPGPAPDPPARRALWRWAWGARVADAGAGLVRPGDEGAQIAAGDLAAIPREDHALVAALAARGFIAPAADGLLRANEVPSRGEVLTWIARDADTASALPMREGTLLGARADGLRVREKRSTRAWSLGATPPDLLAATGGAWHRVDALHLAPGDAVRFVADASGAIVLLAAPERRGATDDRYSPRFRWTVVRDRAELEKSLEPVAPVGRIRDLRVLERGVSGRVSRIEVVGTEGTARIDGFRIRRALGLQETLFEMELQREPDGLIRRAIFRGRGWGHGVGMCQVGAYGMALDGASYHEILGRYYAGATLDRPAFPRAR